MDAEKMVVTTCVQALTLQLSSLVVSTDRRACIYSCACAFRCHSFLLLGYVQYVTCESVSIRTLTVFLDGKGHGFVVKLVVGVCQDDAPLTEGGVRRQRQYQVGYTCNNIT